MGLNPALCQPPDPSKQEGEISGINLAEKKRKNPYQETQNSTISKLAKFSRDMSKLAAGEKIKAPQFDGQELRYLGAIYLWCTLRKGACPLVLNPLLEADLVNAVSGEGEVCSNLKGFWQSWIENDMSRRLGFDLSVGLFAKNKEFNKEVRPMYENCVDTVTSLRENAESDTALLQERYQSGSDHRKAPATLAVLLKGVREKIRNIYIELGLKN